MFQVLCILSHPPYETLNLHDTGSKYKLSTNLLLTFDATVTDERIGSNVRGPFGAGQICENIGIDVS